MNLDNLINISEILGEKTDNIPSPQEEKEEEKVESKEDSIYGEEFKQYCKSVDKG